MKAYFLICLLISSKLFSQSLGVGETIYYINKVLDSNTYTYYDQGYIQSKYRIALSIEGFITISLYRSKGTLYGAQRDTLFAKFNVQDIKLGSSGIVVQTIKHPSSIEISCKSSENCVNTNFYQSNFWDKTLTLPIPNFYEAKKVSKALIYLISICLQQGYVRQEKEDPFIPTSRDIEKKPLNENINGRKISIKLKEGVYHVPVMIQGTTEDFVIDSGAGECNISSSFEKKLKAKGILKEGNYLPDGLYQLADGSILSNRRVLIPSLIVGGKVYKNITASIGPENSPNLLGLSFLNKHGKWSINSQESTLEVRN